MGQAISAARDEVKEIDKTAEDKAKQDLEILEKMVDNVLDKYEANLNAKFLSPDSTAKTQIPGIRPIRQTRFSTAEIEDKPAAEVNKAIDSFFSIGQSSESGGEKKEGDTKDKLLNGFKVLQKQAEYLVKSAYFFIGTQSTVNTALNVFLGNTSVGQKEETKYFIYMHHNSVVRMDVKLWRWNFAGSGISDKHKSVLGYIICLSIVDVTVLKTNEFIYLISEYAGDKTDDVVAYCDSMEKMYKAARKLKQSQKSPPADE